WVPAHGPTDFTLGACKAQALGGGSSPNKKSRPASTTRFLPDDVVGEVLLRLPSKSLARFRSVCRSWDRLISSSAFIETHQALAVAKPPTKFALVPTAPPHQWNLFPHYDVPCLECPRIIGPKPCRGGLVLLGQRCTRTYSVCNPSTGGRLRLPPCLTGYSYLSSCAGIGFHERTGEYKVVVIASPTDYRPRRCEVLTVGDPAGWRAPAGVGSCSLPASFHVQNMDPVVANGCLHWALRGASRVSDNHGAVLSFSLASESFRRLPLPPFTKDDVRRCFKDDSRPYAENPRKPRYIKPATPTGPVLAELAGHLRMLRDLRHRDDMDGTFEVWRLDDDEHDSSAWSLTYRVDLAEHAAKRLMTTWFVVPLCYLAGGGDGDSCDRIMLATTMQEVHVYDPRTRTLETVVSVVDADEKATSPNLENRTKFQQESTFSLCGRDEDLLSSKDFLRFVLFQESLVHLEGMEYGNTELEILDARV
ncbi:hypothetical protein SORBI_3008G108700, partial [Sorghum bicolor]